MASNQLYEQVQVRVPNKSAHDLSFFNRFTADWGKLYPAAVKLMYPGDKFQFSHQALVRMMPLVSPALIRVDVDIRSFFVPLRLVCSYFDDFIYGGTNGQFTAVLPYEVFVKGTNYSQIASYGPGSLCDFLGFNFPNNDLQNDLPLSVLRHKAYWKIWNDWYRDELLDAEKDLHIDHIGYENLQSNGYLPFAYRRYSKDYFTSARPNAQLGTPVSVPFSASFAPVVSDGPIAFGQEDEVTPQVNFVSTFNNVGNHARSLSVDSANALIYSHGLKADLSGVSMSTITDLRRAFRLQEWQEKASVGGNRAVEASLMHFGVVSKDARLARAAYLGGTSTPIVISDIEQTSQTSDVSPLGELAGKGTAVATPKSNEFTADEHGFFITLVSVLPHVGYEQGIARDLMYADKFDFMWPEFATIGEQAIYNDEIFAGSGKGTFGYQSRYAELKSSFDEVHGEFKTSLNHWVQNRRFANLPGLNSSFIGIENSISQLNNIFAVTDEGTDHFVIQLYNQIFALRPLPRYSTPGIL